MELCNFALGPLEISCFKDLWTNKPLGRLGSKLIRWVIVVQIILNGAALKIRGKKRGLKTNTLKIFFFSSNKKNVLILGVGHYYDP